MVKTKEDLVGRKVGRLIVIKQVDDYIGSNGKHYDQWMCECSCEDHNIVILRGSNIRGQRTLSCGCLRKEVAAERCRNNRKTNKYSTVCEDQYGKYYIGYTNNTNAKFFVDADDFDKIKDYCWSKNPEGYVISTPFGQILRMHILIMNPSKGHDIDHVNHDVADNRKANLRECEHYQNIIATKTYSNNTSGRKGVYYDKSRNKWMAILTVNKKTINLGRFNMYDEAVKARENAERIYHKDFHYNEHEKG